MDRPETWSEYLRRRAMIATHRQALDHMAAWLRHDPTAFYPLQIAFERQEMFRQQLRIGILQNLECTGCFQGYYLSDAERRRLEGKI